MNYSSVTNKFTKLKSFKVKVKCFYAKLLHDIGFSVKTISKHLKLTESRIYQYLKK